MSIPINKLHSLLKKFTQQWTFWVFAVTVVLVPTLIFLHRQIFQLGKAIYSAFEEDTLSSILGWLICSTFIISVLLALSVLFIIKSKKKIIEFTNENGLLKGKDEHNSFINSLIQSFIRGELKNASQEFDSFAYDKVKSFFSLLPLNLRYLELIKDFHNIIIFSRTTIEVRDNAGRDAHIVRKSSIINTGEGDKEFDYKWGFTKKTYIQKLLIDGEDKTSELKDRNQFEFRLPKHLPRFEIKYTDVELDLTDCFVNKKEFWKPNNARYPILWEIVTIKLRKKPKSFRCMKNEAFKWVLASEQDAILTKCQLHDNKPSTIQYLLNYQHLSDTTRHNKQYMIEWNYKN